jgi:hypothetical protein
LTKYPFKVGLVARTGIPYVHNGLRGDRDFDKSWVRRERLESAVVLPFSDRGLLLGVCVQFFRRPLAPEHIGPLQASAAIANARLSALHRSVREGTGAVR